MSDTLVVNEIYLSLQGESTFAGLPCIFVRLAACDLRCSYCDTAYAFAGGSKRPLAAVRAEVHRLAAPFGQQGASCHLPAQSPSPFIPLTPALSPSAGERGNPRRLLGNTDALRHGENLASVLPLHRRGREGRGEGEIAGDIQIGPGESQNAESEIRAREDAGHRLPLVELTGGEPLLQKNSLPLMQALCDDGFTVLLETSGAHDIGPVDPRVRRIMDLKCPASGEAARNRWENLPLLRSTDEIKFVIATQEDYAWARQCIADYRLASMCPLLFSWVHPPAPEQLDKSLKQAPPGQTPISRRELAERIVADALPVRFQVQLHKVIWPPAQRGV